LNCNIKNTWVYDQNLYYTSSIFSGKYL